MIGAIIGDVIGSRFEWHNHKSKQFDLFDEKCRFTDDTTMSLAIANALLETKSDFSDLGKQAVESMQLIGRAYPNAGYGGKFRLWIASENPEPYGSFGNGSAMRVSPCAYAANSLEEANFLAEKVTEVTHNHPEGIKGAKAIASAIFLAKTGKNKDEIRQYINDNFYQIDFNLDDIRESYSFNSSCQGSVPQALEAFLESENFEDAIRNAISIGGDSDTIAAISGSIAEAYYGVPEVLRQKATKYLDSKLLNILTKFENKYQFISNENN
jgi:type I restriction enzyme M protein